jgi:hypothetical protein
VTDDPNSVADALDEAEATEATGIIFAALTAAGYEVVPAGTADRLAADLAHMTAKAANARSDADALADRLAAAEAAHLATYETVSRRADAAEARLSALTDAIGDLSGGWTVREGEMILDRIAAAVQPPDPNQPTRRMQ